MSRRIIAVATLIALAATAAVLIRFPAGSLEGRQRDAGRPAPDPAALLSTTDGFATIRPDRALRFPSDHAAHPRHRTESWHLTGTLEGAAERPLGFQLALIRIGLAAGTDARPSRWATSTAYVGFLTLSHPDRDAPLTAQRIARNALGLAGAETNPVRIHIEDWRLEQPADEDEPGQWRLQLSGEGIELALELHPRKPVVTPSADSEADPDRRPPIRFYLQPRLQADGTLVTGEQRTAVTGTVTLQHAWGELPLPGGPVARDRFTLHLDDGRELFLLRTHRVGEVTASSVTGLLVQAGGNGTTLSDEDIELAPGGEWVNGPGDTRYPVSWTLRIPSENIEATMTSYAKHEQATAWAQRVWAGAVRVRGAGNDRALQGRGFMQLSGYDDAGDEP